MGDFASVLQIRLDAQTHAYTSPYYIEASLTKRLHQKSFKWSTLIQPLELILEVGKAKVGQVADR